MVRDTMMGSIEVAILGKLLFVLMWLETVYIGQRYTSISWYHMITQHSL